MRGYLFTENERELLRKWVERGEEPMTVIVLFSRMRSVNRRLLDDFHLFIQIRKRLSAKNRWIKSLNQILKDRSPARPASGQNNRGEPT